MTCRSCGYDDAYVMGCSDSFHLQPWRFGDIVRVPPALVGSSLQPDDRRWLVVGYAKEQWTLLILDRNSPYLGVETHWTDISGFEFVESMAQP